MHALPCVFRHCHRIAPLCCLAHCKHLHMFVAKLDLPSHWRTPPHCMDTILLRASHLHNVASIHHHCMSHRLLRAPAVSHRSGLSRILGYHETCSVWMTWDVFVRDLNRQLGTPSHWLPVNSCKEGKKGRPSGRLHSDAQVSQQETPKTVHLRIGAPRMAL